MAELVSDAPGAAEKSKETFEPPMSLAQSVFRHGRNPTPASEKEILDLVTQRQMAPYYARVCAAFGISKDESLYAKMKDANAAEIAALAAKKEDAEANQGDMEVLDALFDAVRKLMSGAPLSAASARWRGVATPPTRSCPRPRASLVDVPTGSTPPSTTRASATRTAPTPRAT